MQKISKFTYHLPQVMASFGKKVQKLLPLYMHGWKTCNHDCGDVEASARLRLTNLAYAIAVIMPSFPIIMKVVPAKIKDF